MKIFGIGMNYALHTKELGNNVPDEPVVFLMPDTSILRKNQPFYLPSYSQNMHHEVEIVVKICKVGKNITHKFAHTYYEEIGLGIDFTARDIQEKLRSNGHPWLLAKGFDNAAPLSHFVPVSDFSDIQNLNFSLLINGEQAQVGNTKDMMFSIHDLICHLSKYFTLKKGDLIFTGTPAGVGPVKIGDRLEGFIENQKLLDFEIK